MTQNSSLTSPFKPDVLRSKNETSLGFTWCRTDSFQRQYNCNTKGKSNDEREKVRTLTSSPVAVEVVQVNYLFIVVSLCHFPMQTYTYVLANI